MRYTMMLPGGPLIPCTRVQAAFYLSIMTHKVRHSFRGLRHNQNVFGRINDAEVCLNVYSVSK